MRERSKKEGDTSRKLLISAGAVFAEKGYRDTTVAEICERAGANIAAINYHFGSKEALYREAWLYAFHTAVASHPPDGGVPANAPAEDRLRGYIEATLQRATGEDNVEFRIMIKEMALPTGLLDIVAHKAIMPQLRMIENIIRELIGPKAEERHVRFCGMSIVNQCLHPVVTQIGRHHVDVGHEGPPETGNIRTYSDHVFRFSLAGIYAYRRQ